MNVEMIIFQTQNKVKYSYVQNEFLIKIQSQIKFLSKKKYSFEFSSAFLGTKKAYVALEISRILHIFTFKRESIIAFGLENWAETRYKKIFFFHKNKGRENKMWHVQGKEAEM